MKKINFRSKKTVIFGVGLLFVFFSFQSNFFEVAKQIEIYNTLFKELNMYYVDEINAAELTEKAINNTLKDLDPYTNFYNEQDVEEARINREGEYGGIGISVFYIKKGIQIKEILKGYSADKAGLKVGDVIVKSDGQSLQNLEASVLSKFLKGVPNSIFSLEIERNGKNIQKNVKREKIVINSVPFFEMIDEETGYIILTQFSDKASSEVKKAFKSLQKKGMKKLVFDLRSNPGGSLLEAIRISNFFLPKDEVMVSTRAKVKKWSQTYRSSNKPLDLKIPIVVLLNGGSASASEVVSGALQDYDRAVIMGQRSFGKGLVQRYRELTYGTQLKVTIAKYYTPSGRCIQELDYTNRDEKGNVPKFSEGKVNEFKTKNGRSVYDGGGVLPDIILKTSKKTVATKKLLQSKAIFNFATRYYQDNLSLRNNENFKFNASDYKKFKEYLKTDTTFVLKQELLFKKAFLSSKNKELSSEYKIIKKKLIKQKIAKIDENKDLIFPILKDEILSRYFYKEGVFKSNLLSDNAINEATKLLKNDEKYKEILRR